MTQKELAKFVGVSRQTICAIERGKYSPSLEVAVGISDVSDAGIVMTAALSLFLRPSGDPSQRQLLSWENASLNAWGIAVLVVAGRN